MVPVVGRVIFWRYAVGGTERKYRTRERLSKRHSWRQTDDMSSFPTEKYPERSPQTDVGSFCWIALQYYDVKSTTQASPVKEEGRTDRKGATFLDNHGNPPILTINVNITTTLALGAWEQALTLASVQDVDASYPSTRLAALLLG